MSQDVSVPAAAAPTATQAIAYRPDSSGIAGSAGDVLLVLVVLLGATLALALLAKRKGWLQRWTVGASSLVQTRTGLRVEQALRMSPRTTLFRVIDGERRYLLVESSGTVQFIADDSTGAGGGEHG